MIELQILGDDPEMPLTYYIDSPIIDGVNALPLATAPGRGRAGNIEADMLLLESGEGFGNLLVEVKSKSKQRLVRRRREPPSATSFQGEQFRPQPLLEAESSLVAHS